MYLGKQHKVHSCFLSLEMQVTNADILFCLLFYIYILIFERKRKNPIIDLKLRNIMLTVDYDMIVQHKYNLRDIIIIIINIYMLIKMRSVYH